MLRVTSATCAAAAPRSTASRAPEQCHGRHSECPLPLPTTHLSSRTLPRLSPVDPPLPPHIIPPLMTATAHPGMSAAGPAAPCWAWWSRDEAMSRRRLPPFVFAVCSEFADPRLGLFLPAAAWRQTQGRIEEPRLRGIFSQYEGNFGGLIPPRRKSWRPPWAGWCQWHQVVCGRAHLTTNPRNISWRSRSSTPLTAPCVGCSGQQI